MVGRRLRNEKQGKERKKQERKEMVAYLQLQNIEKDDE
jgi:hypothetical protein